MDRRTWAICRSLARSRSGVGDLYVSISEDLDICYLHTRLASHVKHFSEYMHEILPT